MIRSALAYATKLGWPVLPVASIGPDRACSCKDGSRCRDTGKHPLIKAWQDEATTDTMQIRSWWSRWPEAHIGLHADPFWALDVDPRHGGDESLHGLEETNGPLPLTPRQLTGGGGVHYLFRPHAGVRNRSRIMPGLDTRAPGGFIVATPSGHVSGRPYAWDVDAHPLDVSLADAPSWLVEIVTAGNEADRRTPTWEWVALLRSGVDEGARDSTVARLSGHLLRRYIDPEVVLELMTVWNLGRCRPPLENDDIERVVLSVMKTEAKRRGTAA